MADGVCPERRFLHRFAESTSLDADMFLLGVYRVRAINRGLTRSISEF